MKSTASRTTLNQWKALRVLGTLTLVLGLCSMPVLASGSSRGGVTAGPTAPAPTDPFLVTHLVKATVVAVDLEANTFTVRDLKQEKLHELIFTEGLELRAKKKKHFDGRRKLDKADIAEGQIVRLTIREADGALLQVRVEGSVET